jgi:hypothetical protein
VTPEELVRAKDGTASPLWSAGLRHAGQAGNCQIGVGVHLVTNHASLAAKWRVVYPASRDDATTSDAATAMATRQQRAGQTIACFHLCERGSTRQ